jgi:hypothetical protein
MSYRLPGDSPSAPVRAVFARWHTSRRAGGVVGIPRTHRDAQDRLGEPLELQGLPGKAGYAADRCRKVFTPSDAGSRRLGPWLRP